MGFSDQLKSARLKIGYTQQQVADLMGITKSTYCGYETGKRQPDVEKIKKLAKILHTTGDALLETGFISDYSDRATPEEMENIIKKYRALDKHGKETVDVVLDKEYKRMEELRKASEQPEEETESKDKVVIPLMRNRASAGDGVSLEDDDYVPIVVDRTYESAKADYAVRVTGRSMEPKYYDGDILLVRKQPAVDIGQIGIFVIGDNGYVKRQQADRLESLNPEYDDIYPSEYDDVHCSGLVLGKL